MKKNLFIYLSALVCSLYFISCSDDKGEEYNKVYEKAVKKIEKSCKSRFSSVTVTDFYKYRNVDYTCSVEVADVDAAEEAVHKFLMDVGEIIDYSPLLSATREFLTEDMEKPVSAYFYYNEHVYVSIDKKYQARKLTVTVYMQNAHGLQICF